MFDGKMIWITGASSGIGEALASVFGKRGARLILSARREAELARVKEGLVKAGLADGDVHVIPLDVTDETAIAKAVEAAEALGPIDMLINNAGISQRSLCLDTDMSAYRKLFEVDVFGQIALTKAVLPAMVNRGRGHIVITASVAGKVGIPYRTGYCAAKHAVMGFYDALRAEVGGQGIKVTTLTPGFIKTAIAENAIAGDGGIYGQKDANIENGLDVHAFAEIVARKMEKGVPEIAVGGRPEMMTLWLRRFFPRRLFKMMKTLGKPKPVKAD